MMGCRQSYFKNDTDLVEAECLNDVNENGTIYEVDSRLPLDARQMFKLKQSWKGVRRRNISEAGVEMFVT